MGELTDVSLINADLKATRERVAALEARLRTLAQEAQAAVAAIDQGLQGRTAIDPPSVYPLDPLDLVDDDD